MALRYVNSRIRTRIIRLLQEDSRRNLSDIPRRLRLDVRIVAGYVHEIRKTHHFTVVPRSQQLLPCPPAERPEAAVT